MIKLGKSVAVQTRKHIWSRVRLKVGREEVTGPQTGIIWDAALVKIWIRVNTIFESIYDPKK